MSVQSKSGRPAGAHERAGAALSPPAPLYRPTRWPLHPAANARSLQAQAVAAASPEGPYGTNAAQPSRPLLLQQLVVIGHTPVRRSRSLRLGIRLLPSVAAAARRPEVDPFPPPGHYTFLASPAARLAADPAPFPALPALLLFAHPLSRLRGCQIYAFLQILPRAKQPKKKGGGSGAGRPMRWALPFGPPRCRCSPAAANARSLAQAQAAAAASAEGPCGTNAARGHRGRCSCCDGSSSWLSSAIPLFVAHVPSGLAHPSASVRRCCCTASRS